MRAILLGVVLVLFAIILSRGFNIFTNWGQYNTGPSITGSQSDDDHDFLMVNGLESMRYQAEVSYDTNEFSYRSVCEEIFDSPYVPEINDVTCRDSENAYVIYAPYHTRTGVKCIDSTGFAGDLTSPPDISVSFRCK